MKKNEINNKPLFLLDVENLYENDSKLIKIISKTKEMRHNNHSLKERKNNLKNLISKINDESEIITNYNTKTLHLSNENFHKEYNLFNKKHKNNTKIIFKDLMKLYRAKGYRIPNFSINEHNIFKLNPLLENNFATISNGILSNLISKKNNDSEKIICYLKKIGGILSEKLLNDDFKKNLKKLRVIKLNHINEEDSVEELRKQIEILTNLINTNALDKLDEPKKTNYYSYSKRSSFSSNKYRSNKKLLILNKQRNTMSRRNSKILIKKKLFDRKTSTESSLTNGSSTQKKNTRIGKSSANIYRIFNFPNNIKGKKPSKTTKDFKIPPLNLQQINKYYEENEKLLILNPNNFKTPVKPKFISEKNNNIFRNELVNKTPRENKRINWTRNTIQDFKSNLNTPFIEYKQRHLSTIKNINSNNDSSLSDDYYDKNNQTTLKKKNIYPYTNKNDFINYAYYKFSKKGLKNCENYVKNYLNKVEGYDEDKVEKFFNNIYDRNITTNLKELENQITENDIHYKTERLYLNNHLIRRIRPTLKNMDEKDKIILKFEKNLTHAVISKS